MQIGTLLGGSTLVGETSSRSAGSAGDARPLGHDRKPAPARLPLVTTITKIVDVVPLPIRIVIGCLLALAAALAVRSRLAAMRTRRLERQRGELLEDVGLLQAALLPVTPARLGPVRTSAAYRPADGPGAGGDFYDIFALETGALAVIVGDISGHGRKALPHTALVRFTLRAYLEAGLCPREAIQTAGEVLERQLGDAFATVVVAVYEPRKRTLVYSCAGHPPPVVIGSRTIEAITACSSLPIGDGMKTGTRQTVLELRGQSKVCFHTDGITESRVGSELYGAERLQRTLKALGSDATASNLMDEIASETDARPDDMAACLLCIEGGQDAPEVRMEQLELDGSEIGGERAQRFLRACGVRREEIDELLGGADREGIVGNALLEVHFSAGKPQTVLKRSNVTALHSVQARRAAAVGASR